MISTGFFFFFELNNHGKLLEVRNSTLEGREDPQKRSRQRFFFVCPCLPWIVRIQIRTRKETSQLNRFILSDKCLNVTDFLYFCPFFAYRFKKKRSWLFHENLFCKMNTMNRFYYINFRFHATLVLKLILFSKWIKVCLVK